MVSLEQHFARFRDQGDLAALGEVFDAVAAELLVVAAHVAKPGVEPEDVLQATFVEVLRHAQRWDASRPLRPWLMGILFRVARFEARRAARAPDPERVGAGEGTARSPLDEAAGHEVAEQVAAALQALPRTYRQVLVLRLVHGLRPVQIAHALDCPVATVKTRLQRGLARLRALLPAGLAASLAALVGGRGLAQVRAAVLEQARPRLVAATTAATVVSGGLLMKKAIVGVITAGCVLAAWLAWPETAPPEAPRPALAPTSSTMAAASAQPDEDAAAEPSAPPPREAIVSAAPAGANITVVGRVVAAEDGQPLADVVVTVEPFAPDEVPAGWAPPLPRRTGVDGRYLVTLTVPPTGAPWLWLRHPGRVDLRAPLFDYRPGVTVDHGDVAMPAGVAVHARVVDEHDHPVAGWEVSLQHLGTVPAARLPTRPGQPHWGWAAPALRSDADGRYPVLTMPAGDYHVSTTGGPGFVFVGPSSFSLQAGESAHDLTLHVKRPDPRDAIAGSVMDRSGQPVPDLTLTARWPPGWIETRSEPDGRFVFSLGDPQRSPFALGLHDERRWKLLAPSAPVPIGARDVEVIVERRPTATLHLRVVRTDGTPVSRYACLAIPVVHAAAPDASWRCQGSAEPAQRVDDPRGAADLELAPGAWLLVVTAADDACAPLLGEPIQLEPGESDRERIVLEPMQRWRVRVVDDDAEPVAGADVRIRQALGSRNVSGYGQDLGDLLAKGISDTFPMAIVARARTDADGVAVLRAGRSRWGGRIEAESPRHRPAHVAMPETPPAAPIELRLESASLVEGRVTPVAVARAWGPDAAELAHMRLLRDSEQEVRHRMPSLRLLRPGHLDAVAETPIDFDGSVRFEQLPAGDFDVLLRGWQAGPACDVHGDVLVDHLHLDRGDVRQLVIDIGAAMPASLSGTATVDGEPAAGFTLVLESLQAPWKGSRIEASLDDRGAFAVPVAAPGRYRAELVRGRGDDALTIDGDTEVTLAPGQTASMTLPFVRRTLVVQLRNARGEPVVGARLSLRRTDRSGHGGAPVTTDADGAATFHDVPPVALEVLLWDDDLPETDLWLPDGRGHSLGEVRAHLARPRSRVLFTVAR